MEKKNLKKLNEFDKKCREDTPKFIRIMNWIFLMIAFVLFINNYYSFASIFSIIGLICHPFVFPRIKEMFESIKIMNSLELKEFWEEIELK